MLRENIPVELVAYISRMEVSEQNSLLKQLQLRDTLIKAKELDKNQKAFIKGSKRLSDDEIVAIVRSIRKRNAKSKT